MFRLGTPLVTLAAVLTHAVLGCCVHHVHAGEACGHEDVPATVSHDHAGHDHAEHDHAGHSHDAPGDGGRENAPCGGDGPCDGHDCGEVECSLLAPVKVVAPSPLRAIHSLRFDDDVAEFAGANRSGASIAALAGLTDSGGPGDRLRTRVFLL